MNILLCKSHFAGPVSGSDETLVAYATHLIKGRHQLTVVLLYPPSDADQYYRRLKQAGIEVVTIAPYSLAHIALKGMRMVARRLPRFFRRPAARWWRPGLRASQRLAQLASLLYLTPCRNYFKQCPADLIHVMTPDPGAAVMIRAGHAARIPVFYHELGTPQYLPELKVHYDWFARVLPLCSEVSALSPLLARQWDEKVHSANPVTVLPLLVEDTRPDRRLGAPQRQSSGAVTFGFAARLERGKGPLSLVEAFARVRLELSYVSLKMAGAGPQKGAVRARARALGVLDACDFPGAYTAPGDKSDFMEALDVFVLPTLAEGTPNSIIEAMAHGLPVIASAVGGIPDMVSPKTGILVPPGDTSALADAMLVLASDAELRARMGRAARTRYEELFSPQAVLPALVDRYRHVAARSVESGDAGFHAAASRPPSHPWS